MKTKDWQGGSRDNPEKEKILLVLLPFWTPQIPPLGISCLKSFLRQHGYMVKTVDLNVEVVFDNIYNQYFNHLQEYIPQKSLGNFYNIGSEVLQNHLMAHSNHTDKKEYIELVKQLIYRTFFHQVQESQIMALNRIAQEFYTALAEYFPGLLEQEQPTVLGLSVYDGTLPASLFAFRLAREKYPHIRTVMGGGIFADRLNMNSPEFETFLEQTPYIDKIIIGEGELLFLKLLRGQLPLSQRVYTLEDINGETLDLSFVKVPDFSDFDLSRYFHLSSYVSRSCPFQCTFCSETLQWGKYRKKKADQVVQELTQLYREHGSQLFLLGDSLLNPLVDEISHAFLKAKISLYWDGYLRADSPVDDPGHTLLWRRGGFYRARLGLESGSPRILSLMGKHLTPTQIKQAVSSLASAGIKTTTYWVIGYPGETEEDFRMTLDLIEELRNNIYEAECNPFHYYLTGQVNSEQWAKQKKNIPLYPEKARDMLMIQTWILVGEPSREETYKRVNRFVQHCSRLGIPNPYSLQDIYEADERWKKLRPNAVPSLVEFENKDVYINECINAKKLFMVQDEIPDDGEWEF